MSEDSSFNTKQKKKEECRSVPDFLGSLGKGMVPKENLETLGNSSGLTPLGYGVDVRKGIFKTKPVSEGLSTTENTKIFKDSSGLTPLRPFITKHKEVLE